VPTIVAGVTVLEMALGDGVLTPAQIEKAMIVGMKIKEALARSHKAGARIAFGTDIGVGPVSKHARPIERIFAQPRKRNLPMRRPGSTAGCRLPCIGEI
jgi:hypothetical protein